MWKKCSCLQRATILIVGLMIVFCLAAYIGVRSSHSLFVPNIRPDQPVAAEEPGIVSCTAEKGGLLFTPLSEGSVNILDGDQVLAIIDCGAHGFMYEHLSGRYTGSDWVRGSFLLFLASVAVVLLIMLRQQMKTAFFHYATPLILAFLLLDILLLLSLLLYSGSSLENALSMFPSTLILFTLPVMFLFAAAMLISNISLLRHEGKTWRNLLGSLIGFAIVIFTWIIIINSNVTGSLDQIHFHDFLINFFSGLVLWTECKLAGIILCGVKAAKNQPKMDKDYILILGCKLSRKGGLTPLLRGRVDRALQFARQQQAASGHMPVLIPCGGQGKDELRSEASAMCEYLLEQGVPENGIMAEDRSVNTWENIRNAQAMMKPGAKVAYSTTNYHVFRAGVWASRNGLPAEGMGSRTKWYYWPNAFMREYTALITANWVHELVMIVMIGIQSGVLAYLYH